MVSARSNLVGRLGTFAGPGAVDLSVGFRAAIAIELPGIADFLDFIEIQFGNEEFILVAAGLLDDFPTRVAEIALAIEFADFPGSFRADAIDSSDEVGVGDSVRGLLKFPEIFREAGDGGGGVVNDFGAVEAQDARAFGKMPVVTNVNADARVAGLEDRITSISR